jgi:transposase-like protein
MGRSAAVKLITASGVSVAQGSRDLGVHQMVLRAYVKDLAADCE